MSRITTTSEWLEVTTHPQTSYGPPLVELAGGSDYLGSATEMSKIMTPAAAYALGKDLIVAAMEVDPDILFDDEEPTLVMVNHGGTFYVV